MDPKELRDFILVSQTTSNQKLLRGKNCPKSGMYPEVFRNINPEVTGAQYHSIGGNQVGSKKQRWAWKEGGESMRTRVL